MLAHLLRRGRGNRGRGAAGLALRAAFAYNFGVMPERETGLSAQQQLQLLQECLEQDSGFADVVAAACQGQATTLDGVWGSSCALVAAALAARNTPAPVVVVTAKSAEIDDLVDSLRLFSKHSAVTYPTLEERPRKLIEDESYGDRLRTLKQLLQHNPPAFVVTSIQSLLQPAPDRSTLQANTRWIRHGDRLDLESVTRWLALHRYHATGAVELPGEFSLRGGILDVFALDWLAPVRIELFGDQVESLRQFDVATQRSLAALSEVEITVQTAGSDTTPAAAAKGCLSQYLPAGSLWLWIEPDQIRAEGAISWNSASGRRMTSGWTNCGSGPAVSAASMRRDWQPAKSKSTVACRSSRSSDSAARSVACDRNSISWPPNSVSF